MRLCAQPVRSAVTGAASVPHPRPPIPVDFAGTEYTPLSSFAIGEMKFFDNLHGRGLAEAAVDALPAASTAVLLLTSRPAVKSAKSCAAIGGLPPSRYGMKTAGTHLVLCAPALTAPLCPPGAYPRSRAHSRVGAMVNQPYLSGCRMRCLGFLFLGPRRLLRRPPWFGWMGRHATALHHHVHQRFLRLDEAFHAFTSQLR